MVNNVESKCSRPIGIAEVRHAIDDAERGFRSCWNVLCSWKTQTPELGRSLLEFQPTLAKALFDLEHIYDKVVNYRDFLIASKERRSRTTIPHRLRALDRYKSALEEVMSIGRSLGDAFAWVFYQKSPDVVRKHLVHQAVRHFPTGIGGRGEVEFIRHARAEKHFVLHHGITTFLRVGDVSFIDLQSWTVVALGELKSHGSQPGTVNITLHAISNNRDHLPRLLVVPGALQAGSRDDRPAASTAFTQRLKRQVSEMNSALAAKEPGQKSNLFNAYHTQELSELAGHILKRRVAYTRVGDGGVLVAVRPFRRANLASLLFSRQTGDKIVAKLTRLPTLVVEAADANSSENSLRVGELTTVFGWGRLPFFWWPVDNDFLEKLYFRELLVFSVYNPVHLIAKLRAAGFEVADVHAEYPTVKKRFKDAIAEVENFKFFVMSIQHYLMREDKIVEVLTTIAKEADIKGAPGRIAIDMVPRL
jgi:hypothetical protein